MDRSVFLALQINTITLSIKYVIIAPNSKHLTLTQSFVNVLQIDFGQVYLAYNAIILNISIKIKKNV